MIFIIFSIFFYYKYIQWKRAYCDDVNSFKVDWLGRTTDPYKRGE